VNLARKPHKKVAIHVKNAIVDMNEMPALWAMLSVLGGVMNNTNTVVNDLLMFLKKELGFSQNKIARLTGLDPHTIMNNRDEKINDVKNRKIGKRIFNLFVVCVKLNSMGVQANCIEHILNMYVYEDIQSNLDSFNSANRQDKYSIELLCDISTMAHNKFYSEQVQIMKETVVKGMDDIDRIISRGSFLNIRKQEIA